MSLGRLNFISKMFDPMVTAVDELITDANNKINTALIEIGNHKNIEKNIELIKEWRQVESYGKNAQAPLGIAMKLSKVVDDMLSIIVRALPESQKEHIMSDQEKDMQIFKEHLPLLIKVSLENIAQGRMEIESKKAFEFLEACYEVIYQAANQEFFPVTVAQSPKQDEKNVHNLEQEFARFEKFLTTKILPLCADNRLDEKDRIELIASANYLQVITKNDLGEFINSFKAVQAILTMPSVPLVFENAEINRGIALMRSLAQQGKLQQLVSKLTDVLEVMFKNYQIDQARFQQLQSAHKPVANASPVVVSIDSKSTYSPRKFVPAPATATVVVEEPKKAVVTKMTH